MESWSRSYFAFVVIAPTFIFGYEEYTLKVAYSYLLQ